MSARCSYIMGDILGGTPRRCKREVKTGKMCWQHSSEARGEARGGATAKQRQKSPEQTPVKKFSPKVSPPKRTVTFAPTKTIKKISPRDKTKKGGIAWAEPITDLQSECISSVIDVFGIWDREDLEKKGKNLTEQERRMVTTCIRIMEGEMPSSPYKNEVIKFSNMKERRKDTYRRMVIARESGNF